MKRVIFIVMTIAGGLLLRAQIQPPQSSAPANVSVTNLSAIGATNSAPGGKRASFSISRTTWWSSTWRVLTP